MDTNRTFTADSEPALWAQVAADMARQPDLFDYRADLCQPPYCVHLVLDIDLGGGFEGGYELTTLRAVVPGQPALRFALHEQDWVHEIGKLLGLQDVELGYAELDRTFIISTNDANALRQLLADPAVHQALLRYPAARFTLAPDSEAPEAPLLLSFSLERAVVEPEQLRELYQLLLRVLQQLAPQPLSPPAV
ncbi:hypothetical protein [Hymenobacter actinosclerus]|uniref:Uncharacterized protein n=1 Tax=Hymenobacter actinosclerus TaxID=82805 RepID=A0A1I0HBK3_9BACT|nr:hypothetical protein [Hymenobacter actinosclerus]SET81176.1 hypothetical protein SAMN04487998_2855 [Hymenobacter actinosclerus]